MSRGFTPRQRRSGLPAAMPFKTSSCPRFERKVQFRHAHSLRYGLARFCRREDGGKHQSAALGRFTRASGVRLPLALFLATALSFPAISADLMIGEAPDGVLPSNGQTTAVKPAIVGRASVIDGATLWFAHSGQSVRLAGIEGCAVPQWAYQPELPQGAEIPLPFPCGALAKAWLKRTVGNHIVACRLDSSASGEPLRGRCLRDGRDLAVEMLRVGMARVASGEAAPAEYLRWQDHARSARYGMWGTFVLDIAEWRARAVDKTLARMPIADFNLLAERRSEISPPFQDARERPSRRDR